jgi:hypothetical protein
MTLKTQFLGPVASGLDTGAPATTTKSFGRFTTWTPVTTLPVTAQTVAAIPFDGILEEINVWKAGSYTGEASFRFGTGLNGSDNLGVATVTAGNAIYRPYISSATAQTTLPYGRARLSSEPTQIYFSSALLSGTTANLTSACWIEVVYTRVSLVDRPDLTAAMKGNDTTYQGPIISGAQDVGIPSRASFGNLQTVQQVTARAAPVTAQVVGCIPYGAQLAEINFHCRTAPTGEATVRFSAGSDGDNLGSVTVSGSRIYSVALTTAVRATFLRGINAGSAQAVQMTITAASGSVAALEGMAELVFTRHGQSEAYPGVGQKETTFQGPIATGLDSGRLGSRQGIGWGRLSRLTTTIPSTNGVVSGALVGYIPIGAAIVEINYYAATAAAGEATVRFTTSPTVFTSNNLGSVSVSAAGVYAAIDATAATLFNWSGVNRALSGATAQAVYMNVAAASGSIASLSAQAAVEIVYTRLDPSIYGV